MYYLSEQTSLTTASKHLWGSECWFSCFVNCYQQKTRWPLFSALKSSLMPVWRQRKVSDRLNEMFPFPELAGIFSEFTCSPAEPWDPCCFEACLSSPSLCACQKLWQNHLGWVRERDRGRVLRGEQIFLLMREMSFKWKKVKCRHWVSRTWDLLFVSVCFWLVVAENIELVERGLDKESPDRRSIHFLGCKGLQVNRVSILGISSHTQMCHSSLLHAWGKLCSDVIHCVCARFQKLQYHDWECKQYTDMFTLWLNTLVTCLLIAIVV